MLMSCLINYTLNYILNCGLQDAYELFLNSKEKFIEEVEKNDEVSEEFWKDENNEE